MLLCRVNLASNGFYMYNVHVCCHIHVHVRQGVHCIYTHVHMYIAYTLYMYMCMYIHVCRDNLASDGFYGLVIVLLALLGFISVVWLQDQIRNGGGPQWLEQDRMEVNRIQRQVNNLPAQVDNGPPEEQATDPPSSPEQAQAATQVSLLQEKRTKYMKLLQVIQRQRFDFRLEALRIRELDLSYDLDVSRKHLLLLLRRAQKKRGRNLDSWRAVQEQQRLLVFRREVADNTALPPDSYCPPHLEPNAPPPQNWGEPLTKEELAIIKVSFYCLSLQSTCIEYKSAYKLL